MARDGSGKYIFPQGNPVIKDTIVSSTWANTTMKDLGDELTNSLPRDGQAPMLRPLRHSKGTYNEPSITFNDDVITGLYLKQSGTLALTATANDVLTLTSTSATVNVPLTITQGGTQALNVGGNAYVNGNVQYNGLMYMTPVTVTAAANNTATGATALTKTINVITTATETANSVVLPSGAAGSMLVAINKTAQAVYVFPPSTGKLNNRTADSAIMLPAYGSLMFICSDAANDWWGLGAVFS